MAVQRGEKTGYDGDYTFYKTEVDNVEEGVDRQGRVRFRTIRGSGVGWGDTPAKALASLRGESVANEPSSDDPEKEAYRLLNRGYPYTNFNTGKTFSGDEAVERFTDDTMPFNDDSLIGKLFKKIGL